MKKATALTWFAALSAVSALAPDAVAVDLLGFMKKKDAPVQSGPESDAAAALAAARSLESQGDEGRAVAAYRDVVRRYGLTNSAGTAQMRMAQILDRQGEFDPAYNAYAYYVERFPNGAEFERAVEAMFRIGKLFLDGQKRKVMGLKLAGSMSRAQEMFQGIVAKAPYSRFAPLAQFNLGQALEKQGKPTEALAAYQQVISRYPSDAIADDAQYQIGYVLLGEVREGSRDTASARRAAEAFEEFLNRYPKSEKAAQARENLKSLQGGTTKNSLEVARFYDKTKNYKAAAIYYREVIATEPGSENAKFSQNRLAELRSQVGDDALRAGPSSAQTGADAAAHRKLQAKVDVASRPDYAGPSVYMPPPPAPVDPNRPLLRTPGAFLSPLPAVEPPLPIPDAKLPGVDAVKKADPNATPSLLPEEGKPTPAPAEPAPAEKPISNETPADAKPAQ